MTAEFKVRFWMLPGIQPQGESQNKMLSSTSPDVTVDGRRECRIRFD